MRTLDPPRSAQVTVRCQCGDVFEITGRSYRRHLAQRTDAKCTVCRRRTTLVVASTRYRNYWLKRYPREWIVETAAMIWGEEAPAMSWTDGH